jgi:threonine synthase
MKAIFTGYQCSLCSTQYAPGEVTYTCPKDGGNLDVVLDYPSIQNSVNPNTLFASQDFSLWRYLPLLPVDDPGGYTTPIRAAGWTPLYSPLDLQKKLGLQSFWIKDESRNPTASFKDRASAVVVAHAQEANLDVVVTASTGNAGAALAGMAAAVGQKAVIFAPRSAPPAKIAQLLIYGAQVLLVDGNYDQAFDLSIQASQAFGWYCRNTGYNPLTAEGKKTAAYEIWECLLNRSQFVQEESVSLSGKRPLNIFVSVGDGNIISGIHKGFKDLVGLGWMEKMPRLWGVQAEGSAAILHAFQNGSEVIAPIAAHTLADSISVDLPRDGIRALQAARQSGGAYIGVSDDEILSAVVELGRIGIFAEPAGAAAYAGLIKALQQARLGPEDPVLVINTGSGLKDIRAATQAVSPATVIEPTLDALLQVIKLPGS